MCKKRNSEQTTIYRLVGIDKIVEIKKCRVDGCLVNLIYFLNVHGCNTLGSCCGHGRYRMTIVYRSPNGKIWELLSGAEIPRKKKFYKKDLKGFYFLPEVENAKK